MMPSSTDSTPVPSGQSPNSSSHNLPTPPSMVQLAAAVLNAQAATSGKPRGSELPSKLLNSAAAKWHTEKTDKIHKTDGLQLLSPPQFFDANAETEDEEPGTNESKDNILLYSPSPASSSSQSSSVNTSMMSHMHSNGSSISSISSAGSILALNDNKLIPDLPISNAPSRISLSLLLEASAAAAEAEKQAEKTKNYADYVVLSARADRYITETISKVHTLPRIHRNLELKPIDRRSQNLSDSWTRLECIKSDPQLYTECMRLVRGTQGCGRDCELRFKNLIEFAKHIDETHDINFRPYMCPSQRCPWGVIGFHERSECTRHIRTKHYKAMYSCKIEGCTKVYNRSDAFRRHFRRSHATVMDTITFHRDTMPSEETDSE